MARNLHGGAFQLGEFFETISLYLKDRLGAGRPGFSSRQGQGYVLISIATGPALGPTQPLVQWAPGALNPSVGRPAHGANQSPQSSAEVGSVWNCTSTPPLHLGVVLNWAVDVFMEWFLLKHRDNFYLYLYLKLYGLHDRGFECRKGLGISLFTTAPWPALGLTQPPIQWVPANLSLGVKRPGREAHHSPPSSAEVENAWSSTSTPPVCLHGVVFIWSTGTFGTSKANSLCVNMVLKVGYWYGGASPFHHCWFGLKCQWVDWSI
jgi:hypothetical protein